MFESLSVLLTVYLLVVLLYFIALNVGYTLSTIHAYRAVSNAMAANPDQDALGDVMYSSNARPVSIIVPAYNEALNILDTIESLLLVEYPEYEIIVVNDGSTDDTLELLRERFKLQAIERPVQRQLPHADVRGVYLSGVHQRLWVIDKVNGGKADALNAGIELSSYPLFCAIDADSLLEPDALLRMGQKFLLDRELVAAGGAVRVLNGCTVEGAQVVKTAAPRRIIECIQVAEYMRAFMVGRVTWQSFRSLLIISGAFGVFRKDLILAIGGYRKTVGEDMDLVIRLHRHCVDRGIRYKVHFVPEPVCWTQVPDDLLSLCSQRNRWQRGLVESLWFNRGMILNPRYGFVGLVGFPYFIFIELLGLFVEFSGYVGLVAFALLHWINATFALLFFLVAVGWGMWINTAAVLLDNLVLHRYQKLRDVLKIALVGSLEFFGYRQVVVVERVIATFQIWRSHWGGVRRTRIGNEPQTVPPK
jgi:cellulose synthase/poly-beta-1,6-N-acetylglucosamine synthase-like glycosyltransferase